VDLATNYTAPGAEPVSTERNADRQVTKVTLPGNQVLDLAYDSAGRPGTNTLAEDSIRFAYDSSGRLASLTATSGLTIAIGYNGSLVTTQRWTGTVTGMLAWTYDNNFRVTSRRINATSVSYGYDNDSLLTGAGDCAYTRSANNGLLVGSAIGVVTDAYKYSQFGEVTNYTACSNGTAVYVCTYTYDKAGRIITRSETIDGDMIDAAYGYDVLGRLTSAVAVATGSAVSYTNYYAYDANGNRTNWILAGTTYSATYDNQDRLLSWTGGTNQFSAAGFVTNYTINGSVYAYRYDANGGLRSMVLPEGGAATNIEYVIDPLGRRAGRKVDGVLSNGWIYSSGLAPVAETTGGGTTLSKVFVYGRRVNVPDYYIEGGVNYRIITDHLGSPRLVMRTDTGTILQRVDYDDWGRVLVNTDAGFQPFGFAGGLTDNDSSLVRFGARDYDPETGRWTAKDPILFAGGSPCLFEYCCNDPMNFMDNMGLGGRNNYYDTSKQVNSAVQGVNVILNSGSVHIPAQQVPILNGALLTADLAQLGNAAGANARGEVPWFEVLYQGGQTANTALGMTGPGRLPSALISAADVASQGIFESGWNECYGMEPQASRDHYQQLREQSESNPRSIYNR
jgi:RHS repeat-associated protein